MKHALLLLAAAAALASCHRQDAASLTAIVKSALVSDSSLDANKIDVENKGGNVALYGSVETPKQKEKAERIVMSVGGVKAVANHLTVRDDGAGVGSTSARGLPDPR